MVPSVPAWPRCCHNNGSHIVREGRQSGGRLKYILDIRDFPDSPFADKVIHDFSIIENDPEVDVVVETIGGAKVALDYHPPGPEGGQERGHLQQGAGGRRTAMSCCSWPRRTNVSYLFEASVGGGIPIIRPLQPVPGRQ